MSGEFLPYSDGSAGGSGNSKKALLGVLAGALVLALVGYFVVLPKISGDPDTVAVTIGGNGSSKVKNSPTKKAPKKKAAAPKQTVTTTYSDTIVRDPFKPLWIEEATAPTAPGTVPPGTANPGQAPTTPTTPTTPTGGSTGGSKNVAGQRVALVKVFTRDGKQFAQTRVGDVVHTPAVGQNFGGSFQLLAVSGKSATYLFGDEQFTLSEGQEVLK